MKVVLYKSYSKNNDVLDHSTGEVFHNFNDFENVVDISEEDYNVLIRAVDHFNSTSNKKYVLGIIDVTEKEDNEELNSLLNDFKNYEKVEAEKYEKMKKEAEDKKLAAKAKSDAKKHERNLKKLAKELNLSVEDVQAMLANKNNN